MKETRYKILKTKLPHLSAVERLIIKTILFWFKSLIIVENEENLALANDPIIYTFNHNNYLETILVSFYLIFRRDGKKISFVIDWMYGQLPILRWLFNRIKPIYVHNKNAKIAFINRRKKVGAEKMVYQECIERLKNHQSIGIFPEGTRNNHPFLLKRGRKGVGAMILASGAAVIPIGIIYPQPPQRGGSFPWGTMILRIGKPLNFTTELNMARHLAENHNLSAVKSKRWSTLLAALITHRVMEALARLSGKQYPYPAPQMLL
ncbi:MAG: lysophospholipid acyltransferase family protein [Thermodesulfobacteriota bacterium]